jgi:hypothetical protein
MKSKICNDISDQFFNLKQAINLPSSVAEIFLQIALSQRSSTYPVQGWQNPLLPDPTGLAITGEIRD